MAHGVEGLLITSKRTKKKIIINLELGSPVVLSAPYNPFMDTIYHRMDSCKWAEII